MALNKFIAVYGRNPRTASLAAANLSSLDDYYNASSVIIDLGERIAKIDLLPKEIVVNPEKRAFIHDRLIGLDWVGSDNGQYKIWRCPEIVLPSRIHVTLALILPINDGTLGKLQYQ
jgi:hypothetical protein